MLLVTAGADDVAAGADELAELDTVTNTPPGPVDVEDFRKSLGNSVVTPMNPNPGSDAVLLALGTV